MASHKVELVLGAVGKDCRLMLDGAEVEFCRSVSIHAKVGELTTVTFELINCEVTVTGEAGAVLDVTTLEKDIRVYAKVPEAESPQDVH